MYQQKWQHFEYISLYSQTGVSNTPAKPISSFVTAPSIITFSPSPNGNGLYLYQKANTDASTVLDPRGWHFDSSFHYTTRLLHVSYQSEWIHIDTNQNIIRQKSSIVDFQQSKNISFLKILFHLLPCLIQEFRCLQWYNDNDAWHRLW